MTTREVRPKSQASNSPQLRNPNATPQRTRVIYKNKPEDFSLTENKTLYEDSYAQKPKPKTPVHVHNKTTGIEKLTLADIGSMSAALNDKTSATKKRESESQAPQSRKSTRRGNVSGDLYVNAARVGQSVDPANFR